MIDDKSYREEIETDLTVLAEKWRDKGMPGLAAILVLTNEFYKLEMEGYLLGIMAPLHRFMARIGVCPCDQRSTPPVKGTARTSATGREHPRRDGLLGHAQHRKSSLKAKRAVRRR